MHETERAIEEKAIEVGEFQGKQNEKSAVEAFIEQIQLPIDYEPKKETEDCDTEDEESFDESNYGCYNGVATYAGIKKPLPTIMQKILFTILSVFQLLLLIAIGVPVSIVNILLDSVDNAVEKMRSVTNATRIIVIAIMLSGVGWAIFWLVKYLLT